MVEAKYKLIRAGLKQRELAAACGVSEQFLGQVLLGRRKMPRRHALKIKQRFKIPIKSWYTKAA